MMKMESLFKQHIKELTDISNKIKKHKFYKEREIVVKWMFDICREENLIKEVFIQSTNLFDKILIKFKDSNIMKCEYLQLIACACLSIVSKLMFDSIEEEKRLTIKKLIFYTDNTFTIDELCDMEMLLIMNIDWNINDYYNIYNDLIFNYSTTTTTTTTNDQKLNKLMLNLFIFNNIFMLNYKIFSNFNKNYLFLFHLISTKLSSSSSPFSSSALNKLSNSNREFIRNVEKLISNNSQLFSFINEELEDDGFVQGEEDDDEEMICTVNSSCENIIENIELVKMFTIDDENSNSSSCSSGVFTKSSSSVSSIQSF